MMSHLMQQPTVIALSEFLLLDATVKTAVILSLACLLCWMLGGHSAAVRHRIWTCALAGALLIPIIIAFLPAFPIPILPAVQPAEMNPTSADLTAGTQMPAKDSSSPSPFELSDDLMERKASTARALHDPALVAPAATTNAPAMPIRHSMAGLARDWLFVVWFLGAIALLATLSLALIVHRFQSRRFRPVDDPSWNASVAAASKKLGLTRWPRSFQSDRSTIPAVFGLLRAYLVIPNNWRDWSPEQRSCILLHELAHVKRRDLVTQLLGRIAATVHWFNPLAWYALRRLRIERELACDDCVLLAGERASDYAQQLIAMLRMYRPHRLPVGIAMGQSAKLDHRIRSILDASRRRWPMTRSMALVSLLLAAIATVGVGTASFVARTSVVQNETDRTSEPADNPPTNSKPIDVAEAGDPEAKKLALAVQENASAVDKLPKFFIRSKAGSRGFQPIKNPTNDPLTNLQKALDETTEQDDWFLIEPTFAWDEHHFLHQVYTPRGPDPKNANDPAGNPPFWNSQWGMQDIGGHYNRMGQKDARHVLLASAADTWKNDKLPFPNYLLATTHEFWWGDNSLNDYSFNSLPAVLAEYRKLEPEIFDGELCEVVESPMRTERLWISRTSGRLLGRLQFTCNATMLDLYKADDVRKILGRSFATRAEFARWQTSEYVKLPREKRLQFLQAWAKSLDFNTARPWFFVRFRDYREIAPGIWWPFREDRAQGHPFAAGYALMVGFFEVQEVRLDHDLSETIRKLKPKEGESVHDRRFAFPVNYEYRADRTKEEILKLVNARNRPNS